MELLLVVALFSPLVAALFAAMYGTTPKRVYVGVVNSSLIGLSWFASVALLLFVAIDKPVKFILFDWIASGHMDLKFGFLVDQVSAVMMVVVTTVSTLVHVYSIGYMEHDKGFNRFFSYLSAFVFSMMVLVMSDNFLGLFIGWEGVGLCSYLLVGFWYHKKDVSRDVNPSISPSWAANEAFIVNRVADLGMLLGIALIYWQLGTLTYAEVFANIGTLSSDIVSWIAILLFIGAMGKSAQFPLHTWLADAMEGPTPVSALIHAATMVTAGVYLLVRSHEIYALTPDVGFFVACLGAFVAMFAASMALVNNDVKRVIAYSTLSQLGYMFVAAGLGAYWVALFHLMTHAFFKAALFLGAGNVMHAMDDELDIRKMGGLYKVMKPTAIMMSIASVALAGIYPLAGFFSKDKILEVAFGDGFLIIWLVLLVTAGLTAFYSFRVVMMVFFGEERYTKPEMVSPNGNHFHPHEAHKFMLVAISPLILLAVIAGFFEHAYHGFVSSVLPMNMPHVDHSTLYALIAVTLATSLSGIGIAVYKYSRGGFSEKWQDRFCYKLLSNQYYIPNLYSKVFIDGYTALSRFAWKVIDQRMIDVFVDGVAKSIVGLGSVLRAHHNGNLSSMLRLMSYGLIIMVLFAVVLLQMRGA
jgi:NADH-quinone oxidoreductase subunit L